MREQQSRGDVYYLEYRFKGQTIWHQRNPPLVVYKGVPSGPSLERQKESIIDNNTIPVSSTGFPRKPNLEFRVIKQTVVLHKEVIEGHF